MEFGAQTLGSDASMQVISEEKKIFVKNRFFGFFGGYNTLFFSYFRGNIGFLPRSGDLERAVSIAKRCAGPKGLLGRPRSGLLEPEGLPPRSGAVASAPERNTPGTYIYYIIISGPATTTRRRQRDGFRTLLSGVLPRSGSFLRSSPQKVTG